MRLKGSETEANIMISKLTSWGTAAFAMLMVCTCPAAADDKAVSRVEASCSIPVVTNRSSRLSGLLGPTAAEKKAHEEAAKLRKTLKRLFDVDFDATNKVFGLQSANWSSVTNFAMAQQKNEWTPLDEPFEGMTEKKARTAIRNTLFGMTTELSDKEVAEKVGMIEIAQLLLKYTLEEIVAMQNSTKRKITAEYGRTGEVIDNKIDGLNAGKVDVDLDSATKERDSATAELEAVQKELAELNSSEANAEINSEISKLLEEKRSHLEAVVKEINDFNWQNRGKKSELTMKADALAGRIATAKRNVIDAEYEVQRMDKAVKDEQERYKQVKASKLDESKTVCPTCKRRYSEKKVTEIKANFEDGKAKELETITANGKKYATQRDKAKAQVAEYRKRVTELETELAEVKKQLSEIPEDKLLIRADETTKAIDSKVAELKAKMQLASDVRKKELIAKSAEIRSRRDSAMKRIVMAENNERIDAQIAELQRKRKEYEQASLDAERILDEVKQLEMAKNEMLTEQINSHFKLVKWVLFETQANGEILTDRCTPYIDGKSMVDEANTGRVILGKLDIVEGLQNFYGERYPVWLDNAEALTSNTSERIQLDTQLITLSAVDGQKLTVK